MNDEGLPPEDRHSDDRPSDERHWAEALSALPSLDLPPERAELLRRRAHAILRAEQAAPKVGSVAHLYQRSIEPALLVGLGLCQAIWAAHGTWLLLR
jgi:hypothetical protein